MEDKELYSHDKIEDTYLQTSELDDFLDTDNKDNSNNELDEELVSFDPDVTVIKEKPVLSSLDDAGDGDIGLSEEPDPMESSSDELESLSQSVPETVTEETKTLEQEKGIDLEPAGEEDEIIFSDEQTTDDLSKETTQEKVDHEVESMKEEMDIISEQTAGDKEDISTDEQKVDDIPVVLEEAPEQSEVDKETEQIAQEEVSSDKEAAEEEIMAIDEKSEEGTLEEIVPIEEPLDEQVEAAEEQEADLLEEELTPSEESSSFFDTDEDETISLSSDELSNILEDTEDIITDEVPTVDSVLKEKSEEDVPEAPTVEEPVEDIFSSVTEESKEGEESSEETIEEITEVSDKEGLEVESLEAAEEPVSEEIESMDKLETEIFPDSEKEEELIHKVEEESAELEELEKSSPVTSLEEEPIQGLEEVEAAAPVKELLDEVEAAAPAEEKIEEIEKTPSESTSFFDEEDEDESISLTGNELDNILEDAEIVEEPQIEPSQPVESIETEGTEDAAEVGVMEEMVGKEETLETIPAQSEQIDIDKKNLKTIIKYLDDLLENLPEEKIKEFAESEYYDLYNRLLDSLEI